MIMYLRYCLFIIANIFPNPRPVDLFADDTSILDIIDNPTSTANKMNRDLEAIRDWALRWRVTFNPDKTVAMVFSTKVNKPIHPSLIFQGKILTQLCQHKHLGLTLSDNLSWNKHIDNLLTSASKKDWTTEEATIQSHM